MSKNMMGISMHRYQVRSYIMRLISIILVILMIIYLMTACSSKQAASDVSETGYTELSYASGVAVTPDPEATPVPTATSAPTPTLAPTATPKPTATPAPTATPTPEPGREWDVSGIDTSWIDPEKKLVAFTFDDGPTIWYDDILDVLEASGQHATFFVWGDRYKIGNRSDIERVISLGCELGNHTFTHADLTKLTEEKIRNEIEKTRSLLESITGIEQYLVRPPYGSSSERVKKSVDFPMINWSVDTGDWNNGDYDTVFNKITQGISDGDIVLMHASYKFTYEAVRDAIPLLIEDGWQIVTVSELCAVRGKTLKANASPLSSKVK